MNIKDYISSGILESYVLGDLSLEETIEVENLAQDYPEIAKELKQIKNAFIHIHRQAIKYSGNRDAEETKPGIIDEIIIQNKIKVAKNDFGLSFYISVLAASFALLSLLTVSYLYSDYKSAETGINQSAVKESYTDILYDVNEEESFLDESEILSSGNFAKIELTRLRSSSHHVSLFYESDLKLTYIKIDYLPLLTENQQYQLWAIVNDQPFNVGVIPTEMGSDLLKMRHVNRAEAFLITLEPSGGSLKPDLDGYMAYGSLKK